MPTALEKFNAMHAAMKKRIFGAPIDWDKVIPKNTNSQNAKKSERPPPCKHVSCPATHIEEMMAAKKRRAKARRKKAA